MLLEARVAFGAGVLYAVLANRSLHGLSRSQIAAGSALSAALNTMASGLLTFFAFIAMLLLAYDIPAEYERDLSESGFFIVVLAVTAFLRIFAVPILYALPGALGGWLFTLFQGETKAVSA